MTRERAFDHRGPELQSLKRMPPPCGGKDCVVLSALVVACLCLGGVVKVFQTEEKLLGAQTELANAQSELAEVKQVLTAELENAKRQLTAQDSIGCDQPWESWRIFGDDCEKSGPDCIQTVNFPDDYASNSLCLIEFAVENKYMLAFESFDTQANDDLLLVASKQFSGTVPPKRFIPAGGSTIEWITNWHTQRSGWRACLHAPCTDLTCPTDHVLVSNQHCENRTCTLSDIERCCELPNKGCKLPASLNDSAYSVPSTCKAGEFNSVSACPIDCTGDTELDGWSPPQRCTSNSNDSVFELPGCKAQRPALAWSISGPCQEYGGGCVSTANVGDRYGSDESCVITMDRTGVQDDLTYRLWVTHLDTEALFDRLTIENPVVPGTNCDTEAWWFSCYYFHVVRPDPHVSGSLPTGSSEESSPLGPYYFKSITWSSDDRDAGTGFIVCAQAKCSTMACPAGYYYDCEDEDSHWCRNHDCSAEEDLDTCCLAETETFLDSYNFSSGQASNSSWCSKTTTTTTTTLALLPDIIGQVQMELMNESDAQIAISALEGALARFASVSLDAVILAWRPLEHVLLGLDIGFRIQSSKADIPLLPNEELLAEINTNGTQVVSALSLLSAVKVPVWLDIDDHRPYSSACADLYPCSSEGLCWRESFASYSCGRLHEESICGSDQLQPGPGEGFVDLARRLFGMIGLTQEFLLATWVWWSTSYSSPAFGPEPLSQVCCTCGGGTCDAGAFRFSPAVSIRLPGVMPTLCIPCAPGTQRSNAQADEGQCFPCSAGRFSASAASTACELCSQGQYGTEIGRSTCHTCPQGRVAEADGQTSCTLCASGTYTEDHIKCKPCAPGTFMAGNGSSACEACPAGQYMSESGATACLACEKGFFAAATGRKLCDQCDRGQFAPDKGMSACMDCSRGEAQEERGSDACEKCDTGRYAQQEGQSLCSDCPAGTEVLIAGASACDRCDLGYSKGEGEVNCTMCAPGRYASEAGLMACRACSLGSFANAPEAATGCLFCGLGKFAAQEGLTACELCTLGSYESELASTGCQKCTVGAFANTTGLSGCHSCLPGTFASSTGLSLCMDCSAGQESRFAGATECQPCSAGAYASANATSVCDVCPSGSFTPVAGSKSCLPCQAGRFASSSSQTECLLCEPGSYSSEEGMQKCKACSETLPGAAEYWTTMRRPTVEQEASGVKAWTALRGATNASSCGCRPGTQRVGSACEPCGEGLICHGMEVLSIERGYAWDGQHSVWDCALGVEEACPGGEPGRCKPGRNEASIACTLCLDNMVPVSDGSCAKCKDADFLVPCVLALTVLGVMVLCYCLFDSPRRKRPKLSFLLVVASLGQLLTIFQQLGIVALIRVAWDDPFLGVLQAIEDVIFFDMDVLRPSCVFIMGVVLKYIVRVGAVFFFLLAVCYAHLMSQLIQHRGTWRKRWPSLWCSLGTIVLTFFVSILSTMLAPMQCRKHPNDRQTVSWYPSVVCWEGGDHSSMIAIGGITCLLPVFFLAACLWAVRSYRTKVLQAQAGFLNRWAFLFFRYDSEAYWYGPVMLIRNAMVSSFTVLVSPVTQIVGLQALMLASLCLLLRVMPWRVKLANYMDAAGHVCLLMVTMFASFFIEDEDTNFVAFAGVALVGAIPVLVLGLLVYGAISILKAMRKPYQFFLCHHKHGTGAFSRLLKMWLLRKIQRKVFIDSDDLKNLDLLFDVVAHETETLVAINSQNFMMRPWCIGELTTASRSRVRIVPVYMQGVIPPSSDFIENFLCYVPDISCLTQFSIDLPMIQEALKNFASSVVALHPPQELHHAAMDAFCAQLLSANPSDDHIQAKASVNPGSEVVIICNKLDNEAAASALILRAMYNPIVQHRADSLANVLALEESMPSTVKKAMLICTNGMFTLRVLEALLVCQDKGARVLPIINATNFTFPSVQWMEAQPELGMMDAVKKDCVIQAVQAIFLEIAIDFQPSALSGTDATLRTKAKEIATRILSASTNTKKFSDMPGWASPTRSSTKDGACRRSHDNGTATEPIAENAATRTLARSLDFNLSFSALDCKDSCHTLQTVVSEPAARCNSTKERSEKRGAVLEMIF